MVDFKHMHKSNQIKPTSESRQDGWEPTLSDHFIDMLAAAVASALMILGMFYGLSEAVIRGWIG
jgi:hypothetical protein